MKVSEVKQAFGFLRRLEEEGKNVKMSQDINDILFIEEKEREIKEKIVQDQLKKSKKPRPRDVIDFEEMRRRQLQKYFEHIKEQLDKKDSESMTLTGDRFKSIHFDQDAGTGIGDVDEINGGISQEINSSRFKAKNVATFEILSESEKKNAAEHYKKQYGVKPKATRKPISGGFRTRPPSTSAS